MTRFVLYSYPILIACLVYFAVIATLKGNQNMPGRWTGPVGPLGYCTSKGENLEEDERQAIRLAKRFVERTRMGNSWELDGRFRVQADNEGFRVHVLFVSGYSMSGKPILIPGGHCIVNISHDGKVEFGKAPGPSILDGETYQIQNKAEETNLDKCAV